MDNPAFGIISCNGVDAAKFLQGQLSANMLALTATQGALACYLNLKGRVVAMMYVVKRPDAYWLILPADLIPTLLHKLQKFIMFSQAQLVDVSAQFQVEGMVSSPASCAPYQVETDNDTVIFYIQPDHGISLRITPSEKGPLDVSRTFLAALIKAHIPWIGLAQSEKFLPHYIDLVRLGGVSFDKGCFVGQEVVARMHYRGHLDKGLAVIEKPAAEQKDVDMVNELDSEMLISVIKK